jgi:nitronate monooxygenase
MSLTTRLTEFFGIEHPVLLAPMAMISGGRLASAVTGAGGLGLIGGGCGDADWLQSQIGQAGGAPVGYGFITWSLARKPDLLDIVLAAQPATIMLSFGELQPFAHRNQAGGGPRIAQAHTRAHADRKSGG